MSSGDELAAQILGAEAAGRDPKAVRRLSALGLTDANEVWITRQTSDIHKVGVRQVVPGKARSGGACGLGGLRSGSLARTMVRVGQSYARLLLEPGVTVENTCMRLRGLVVWCG